MRKPEDKYFDFEVKGQKKKLNSNDGEIEIKCVYV